MAKRVRLDRALSKLGFASRADAKRLIASGQVTVAGRTIHDPARTVAPNASLIRVSGRGRGSNSLRTILLNKPRGVLVTRRDPEGRPTVFDLLGAESAGLISAGRLDKASTGLLILTTDTQLAEWLTNPETGIVRRYVVTVRGALQDESAKQMMEGSDGLRAASVRIRKRSSRETHLIVELTEGKNREIRRLCEAVGHEVTGLKRVAFGSLELGDLAPGKWRDLTAEELMQLRAAAPASSAQNRSTKLKP
jgi:23S rRNA pseudouridine2605 synthase